MSDLISKQAAREALLKKGQSSKRYKLGETWELNWLEIEDALSSIPIMETEPVKHGEWLEYGEPTYKRCSSCGKRLSPALGIFPQYCPNCGAKMDGGENE